MSNVSGQHSAAPSYRGRETTAKPGEFCLTLYPRGPEGVWLVNSSAPLPGFPMFPLVLRMDQASWPQYLVPHHSSLAILRGDPTGLPAVTATLLQLLWALKEPPGNHP